MIHQPAISGGIKGPASDIKIMSDYVQKNKRRLNQLLAENTGRTIEEIERDTDRDNFMTPNCSITRKGKNWYAGMVLGGILLGTWAGQHNN